MPNRIAAAAVLALLAVPTGALAQSAPPGQPRIAAAGQQLAAGYDPRYYYPSRTNPYGFPMLVPPGAQETSARPRTRIYVTPSARKKRRAVHREPKVNQRQLALRKGFQRVSDLVHFPKFFPGLGIIFVKPETLPLGPFLCFDRKDRLVATVYMVPIKDMQDQKSFEGTAPEFAPKVDHTSIYYNAGHPGVDVPHYHIVLWHVDRDGEKAVAK